ncbi:Uncharacterised protein [uncultured Clostridium sp.]|uniref:GIY-YIG nuclease family protein n=1 Tax=uncultured Clostridium sp. TaxID=59620 RepID=UPI0008217B81|nr:GIY-YIG nuclease family protein [uncultured Clostridium sp.]SCJ99846.1 Uncharacterised protein [uncultured Clostridium sp.]
MTILGTMFPRTKLNKFLIREVANKPGVYILIGKNLDSTEEFTVYVGEGDPVSPRLKSHSNNKDFWTEAIVFTSKDNYLTKTQIQYLESELVKLLNESNRVKLDNNQIPTKPNISEVDSAEVRQFMETIKLILSSLGINILEPTSVDIENNSDIKTELIEFELVNKNVAAKMVIDNDKYIILKGSKAVHTNRPSCPKPINKLKEKLILDGVLVNRENKYYEFTKNYVFSSPSYAGAIIVGGSVNGQKVWKNKGKSLKELETNNN